MSGDPDLTERLAAGADAGVEPIRTLTGAGTGRRVVHGTLAAVRVGDAARAGAWIGFALGLAIGAAAGVGVTWLAGAVLDWETELSATYGIAGNLLPLGGDAGGPLRTLSDLWWVAIPTLAAAGGALTAALGALTGALVALTFNARRPGGVFEIDDAATIDD